MFILFLSIYEPHFWVSRGLFYYPPVVFLYPRMKAITLVYMTQYLAMFNGIKSEGTRSKGDITYSFSLLDHTLL